MMNRVDLADLVIQGKPDLVVCAGYLHILVPSFLKSPDGAHVLVINLYSRFLENTRALILSSGLGLGRFLKVGS